MMATNGHSHSLTDLEDYDHQTSYVFAPPSSVENGMQPPRKRRKISEPLPGEKELENEFWPSKFVPLLNGIESPEFVTLRQQLFKETWGMVESRVQAIIEDSNKKTLGEVTSFVKSGLDEEYAGQIPTGLIVTGPSIASQEQLFNQIASHLESETNSLVIVLQSMDASNLKTVLKKLIRIATNQKGDDDDEVQISSRQNGRKLLNFDLQILSDHLKTTKHSKVVICFQDSEAFESSLLSELIQLMRSWLERIPFVIFFGIATSAELFHERLPASAIRCLHGAQFYVEQTEKTLKTIFESVVAVVDAPLRFGPNFMTSLLERQHDSVQSLQMFVGSLKYAYMCHFYSNPLSVLVPDFTKIQHRSAQLSKEHFEAVRMLQSFRNMIENMLLKEETDSALKALESDDHLLTLIDAAVDSADEMKELLVSLKIFTTALSATKNTEVDGMDLYVEAIGGKLGKSDYVADFISTVQNLGPDDICAMIGKLVAVKVSNPQKNRESTVSNRHSKFWETLAMLQKNISILQTEAMKSGVTLRTRQAAGSKTFRTTVVAQKVQLSREKSTLSELDVSFSEAVDDLTNAFRDYVFTIFEILSPQKLFLNEIWLFDFKSPNREVFTPKPRYAIERALSSPHDYLNCSCCDPAVGALSSTQPPTAILYQLYLESGGLINIYDLWSAFYAIVGRQNSEDLEERSVLVLFYRALADLKLLGMIKHSRKKTDHLAKLAWKGL